MSSHFITIGLSLVGDLDLDLCMSLVVDFVMLMLSMGEGALNVLFSTLCPLSLKRCASIGLDSGCPSKMSVPCALNTNMCGMAIVFLMMSSFLNCCWASWLTFSFMSSGMFEKFEIMSSYGWKLTYRKYRRGKRSCSCT